MRYLMTLNGGGPPADETLFAEMGRFIAELSQAGILVATGGLDSNGTHFTASGGKATLTDGPYAETKETVVSFAVLEVETREQAEQLLERFCAIIGEGSGDMRQVYGP